MITDLEMGVLAELSELCKDGLSKDIVDVVQEMMGDLDSEGFVSDVQGVEFVAEYAEQINDIVKDAVYNNSLPQKKIGDYEILNSFKHGEMSVFLGENP